MTTVARLCASLPPAVASVLPPRTIRSRSEVLFAASLPLAVHVTVTRRPPPRARQLSLTVGLGVTGRGAGGFACGVAVAVGIAIGVGVGVGGLTKPAARPSPDRGSASGPAARR